MPAKPKPATPTSCATRYRQYMRDGFRPMSPVHEQFLDEHKGAKPLVVEDRSLGTICCALVPGAEPVVAMQRARGQGGQVSSIWAFPKGHPDLGEGDVEGAVRETLEEMGINVKKYVKKEFCVRSAYSFADFMHKDAWQRHKDHGNEAKRPVCVFHKEVIHFLAVLPKPFVLSPQEEEVAEAAWIPLSQVKEVTYPDMWAQLERLFASPAVRSMLQPAAPAAIAAPPKASKASAGRRAAIQKTVAKRAAGKRPAASK
jgi:8-oxo-dGTP pyrophosphatase MutT (NUDIX family)